MSKRKLTILIVIIVIIAIIAALCLIYIPRMQALSYDMCGYIVNADGKILEEFTFKITGTEYDFIVEPGASIHFTGDRLTEITHDAHILYFNWGTETITKDCGGGHFSGNYWAGDPRYVTGAFSYYSITQNAPGFEQAMLDLEDEAFCMYTKQLVKNCFIVGLTDPNGDPHAVIETYLTMHNIPELDSQN